MYCKSFTIGNNTVLACCDKGLVGKTFRHGGLKVAASEAFYKGEIVDEGRLLELLSEANNVNLLGKRSVSAAIKKGLITERDVILIGSVPHAVIMRL